MQGTGHHYVYNDDVAIFQDNLGNPLPKCLHSGIYWSKDDGGGEW